jgi:hypothetical protein
MSLKNLSFCMLTAAALQVVPVQATRSLFVYGVPSLLQAGAAGLHCCAVAIRHILPFMAGLEVARRRLFFNLEKEQAGVQYPEPSAELIDLVKARMTLLNVPDASVKQIKIDKEFAAAKGIIFLDQRAEEYLHSKDSRQINFLIASIDHELTHLKNNDFYTIAAVGLAIPVATMALGELVSRAIPALRFLSASYKNMPNSVVGVCAVGLGYAAINLILLNSYAKYREQKADDGIYDDLEILNTMHDVFEHWHENIREAIRKKEGDRVLAVYDKYPFLYEIITGYGDDNKTHPSHYMRTKKFAERIAQLTQNMVQTESV